MFPAFLVFVLLLIFSLSSFAYTYKYGEESTAYVSTGELTSSGVWPEVGYCAVHPSVNGGSTPIIPYGTVLYIDKIVNAYSPYEEWDELIHPDYGEVSTLQVQDIGDKWYSRGVSLYWVDIFWGDDEESADEYGIRYIDYHYN